jgi:hypothetical protein
LEVVIAIPAVLFFGKELEIDDPPDCGEIHDLFAATVADILLPPDESPDRSHGRTMVSALELAAQPLLFSRALVLRLVAVALLSLLRKRDPGDRLRRFPGSLFLLLHEAVPSRRSARLATQRANAAASATADPVRNATRGLNRFQRIPKITDAGSAAMPIAA